MTSAEWCSVSKKFASSLQAHCSADDCLASFEYLYSILSLSIKTLVCTCYVQNGHRYLSYLTGLEVTQDHSNLYHSKAWVRFPILLP